MPATIAAVTTAIAKRATTPPDVLATSSDKGTGIDILRAEIAELL